ncbi:class F sortase [uncultured Kocuria sp.]|uniref:class F sortase n=1 Tax=uncultured Kocuria sp. TaxID=259305 RepID=UPI002593BC3D|nr:class F sortase [uncultured Kocuria sp.]MCT1367639.1 class F sortase [Rothia sp. p3-SID1597]
MKLIRRFEIRRAMGLSSVVAGLALLSLSFLAASPWHVDDRGAWRSYLHDPTLALRPHHRSEEGHRLIDRGPEMTSLDLTTGGQYAPRPGRQFRHAACGPVSSAATHPEEPTSTSGQRTWTAPSVGVGSHLVPTSVGSDGSIPLVSAPDGVWDNQTADIGATTGATLLAGHVNHDDGHLSPWGKLHHLQECSPITATDGTGRTHEYRVTDLYVVAHTELSEHREFLRRDGPPMLYLVTCAGPEAPGVMPGLFQYRGNLVVGAELMHATTHPGG